MGSMPGSIHLPVFNNSNSQFYSNGVAFVLFMQSKRHILAMNGSDGGGFCPLHLVMHNLIDSKTRDNRG